MEFCLNILHMESHYVLGAFATESCKYTPISFGMSVCLSALSACSKFRAAERIIMKLTVGVVNSSEACIVAFCHICCRFIIIPLNYHLFHNLTGVYCIVALLHCCNTSLESHFERDVSIAAQKSSGSFYSVLLSQIGALFFCECVVFGAVVEIGRSRTACRCFSEGHCSVLLLPLKIV